MVTKILICLLWFLISTSIFFEYLPEVAKITTFNKFIVILIIIFGSPIFAANAIMVTIMDAFLPEGWMDKNDEGEDDE